MAGYKGYARERGFKATFNPTAQLTKVKERNAGHLRDLKDRRNEESRLATQHIGEIKNQHELQRRNLDEIAAFEEQGRKNGVEARRVHHELSIANMDTKIQQQKIDDAAALRKGDLAFQEKAELFKGLSQTAYNFLVDQDMKAKEAAKLRAVELVTLYGLPIKQQISNDAAEQLLREENDQIELLSDQAYNSGLPPEVVNEMRNGNTYLKYELLKQYSIRAGENYGSYLQQQMYKHGIVDPADIGANITTLRENYLKQNGLMGLKVDFMAPMLTKMRGIENGIAQTAIKTKVVTDSKRRARESLDLFANNPNAENFNYAIYTIARQYDDDGSTPIGYAAARDMVFKSLEDVVRFSPEEYPAILESIKAAPILDNLSGKPTGQTWGTTKITLPNGTETYTKGRFDQKFIDLENKRIDNLEKNLSTVQRTKDINDKLELQKVKEMLIKDVDSISDDTIYRAIHLLKRKGNKYAGDLEIIYKRRQDYKSELDWDYSLEREKRAGTLDKNDLLAAPPEIIKKWMPIITSYAQLEDHGTYKQEQLKSDFKGEIRAQLGAEQVDDSVHHSSTPAITRALQLYNDKYTGYLASHPPLKAAEQARVDVMTLITERKGDFQISNSFHNMRQVAFYKSFTGGNHLGAIVPLTKPNFPKILTAFSKNPNTYLTKKLIVPNEDFSYYISKIKAGETVPIPGIFHTMERLNPKGPDARYYFNQQLELYHNNQKKLAEAAGGTFKDKLPQIEIDDRPDIIDTNQELRRLLGLNTSIGNKSATINSRTQHVSAIVPGNRYGGTNSAANMISKTGGDNVLLAAIALGESSEGFTTPSSWFDPYNPHISHYEQLTEFLKGDKPQNA